MMKVACVVPGLAIKMSRCIFRYTGSTSIPVVAARVTVMNDIQPRGDPDQTESPKNHLPSSIRADPTLPSGIISLKTACSTDINSIRFSKGL